MPVAYTNHIGRSSRDTHSGKNTAISNASDLGAAEKHNNHDYTPDDVARMQSDIDLDRKHLNQQYVMVGGKLAEVEGHLDLAVNVRKIYEEEFADVVAAYNKQQVASGHPERQISDYFQKISDDKQQEVAVEGLIQFGCLEDWEGKNNEERAAVVPILLRALDETLAELNKNPGCRFVLAGASLHMNEGSPHLHYVGVPIQDAKEVKKGLAKKVKKSAVFTKETLGTGLQDNVRAIVAPMVLETFGWKFEAKKTGRNEDRDKNTQVNEILKEQISENEKKLASLEAQIEAAEASEQAAREKALKAQKNASEAERRAYEAECTLSALEERVELIQDYEEYTQRADEIEERITGVDRLLELIKGAVRIFKQKEAEEFIKQCKKEISELFTWIKKAFGLVKEFEKAADLPEEQRRSPGLDERIKSAEARAGDQDAKGEKEIQR